MEVNFQEQFCCDQPDIIEDNSEIVCKNCGIVQGYKTVKNFIDFHENKFKFRRKSVYHRKYHIENIILDLNIKMSRADMERIYGIFDQIEKIASLIDDKRKRLISINYLLRRIIKKYFPGIPYKNIKITKSNKTLQYYNNYWKKIVNQIQT